MKWNIHGTGTCLRTSSPKVLFALMLGGMAMLCFLPCYVLMMCRLPEKSDDEDGHVIEAFYVKDNVAA